MLDVCRHFSPVGYIYRFIDMLAYHKMNVFHWHLTDDQGWRIEIKKYPKLIEIGSKRPETLIGYYFENHPQLFDGKEHQGYYTQKQIKEIVAYAASKHITVIPEIEMPGHALAALASYPELSCRPDTTYGVSTKWGIFNEVFCPKEETFAFLEGVLDELIAFFLSSSALVFQLFLAFFQFQIGLINVLSTEK
jgi:hexosaminidase